MKVLLVEGKETWRRLFKGVLSLRGMEVLEAKTPKEALNVAVSEKPDVAIVDYDSSLSVDYDFIRSLTETGVPVLVVGYRKLGFDPEAAKSAGAVGVLEKPFKVEDLLEALKAVKSGEVSVEEKTALVLPSEGAVEEVSLEEEETIPVLRLDEEEPETIELEAEVPSVEVSAEVPQEVPEERKELREELTEKVAQSVSQELSQLPIPQEKVEEIIREVAWEVIPEVAEKVIREEIEKLIKSRLA